MTGVLGRSAQEGDTWRVTRRGVDKRRVKYVPVVLAAPVYKLEGSSGYIYVTRIPLYRYTLLCGYSCSSLLKPTAHTQPGCVQREYCCLFSRRPRGTPQRERKSWLHLTIRIINFLVNVTTQALCPLGVVITLCGQAQREDDEDYTHLLVYIQLRDVYTYVETRKREKNYCWF